LKTKLEMLGTKDSESEFSVDATAEYRQLTLKKTVNAALQHCYINLQANDVSKGLATKFSFPLKTTYAISGGVGKCIQTEKASICKCEIAAKDTKGYCSIAVENPTDDSKDCGLRLTE
jgi:hypothetical protein